MNAAVVGAGAWGTALSLVLRDNGHGVTLWHHDAKGAGEIAQRRENPRLPGVPLPPEITVTGDLARVRDSEMVVCAVPSFAVRQTGERLAPFLQEAAVLVSVSKGLEKDTHLRMSEILRQTTGERLPVAVLSGPSHAEEVSRRQPTGCVAACEDLCAARRVQDAFMNPCFRIYTSQDTLGVELSGAMKNIVALACGACDGMGYQDNTRALLMTRAMAELTRLGEALGGSRQTFGGLAGMGDLIVTCTSMHSRNRRAGILIGQGRSPRSAMEEVGAVVEGYYAAESIHQLALSRGVEMPICESIYQVLYRGAEAQAVAGLLMQRAKKDELTEETWL